MSCPLCGERRARRRCPALDKQICSVCCATKRLTEIPCPSACAYLAVAREHPSAATVRQQQRDVSLLAQCVRDLSDRQSQLFFLINAFIERYEPPELQPLIDDDVAEAAAALAATLETAVRGVIYEHRPPGLPADRLATALKPMLANAGERAGSAFERDAAVVLRRIVEATRELKAAHPSERRAYLDVLGRVLNAPAGPGSAGQTEPPPEPRLIVP